MLGTLMTHLRENNILATLKLFKSLAFSINREKSLLQPCQKLVFLGFILDSFDMKVFLTAEKNRENNSGMPAAVKVIPQKNLKLSLNVPY